MTASLSALAVGVLRLTPEFDPDVLSYTAETTNATSKITATPMRENAAVSIKLGSNAIANGGTATWASGENALEVLVKNGTTKRKYVVTVTKS